MENIKELKQITFEEIEKLYIPLAAHFPDINEFKGDKEKVLAREYERVLQMPVYERVEYHDPLGLGAVPVPFLGAPFMTVYTAVLIAITRFNGYEIKINEKQYVVSVFDKKILNKAIGSNVLTVIEQIWKIPAHTMKFDCKRSGSKIMFIYKLH